MYRQLLTSTMVGIWIWLSTVILTKEVSGTMVTASAPVNPVHEGGILSVHCQVVGMTDDQGVAFIRELNNGLERLSLNEDVLSSASDNVFIALRQLEDGATVYFLSIINVKKSDEGKYTCKVIDGALSEVAVDTVDFQVMYFPSQNNPSCTTNANQELTLPERTPLTLICSSEKGHPTVELSWTKTGNSKTLKAYTYETNDKVFSVLNLTASMADDRAMFICEITSTEFPYESSKCHVGPFAISPDLLSENNGGSQKLQPTSSNDLKLPGRTATGNDKNNLSKPSKCQDECPLFSFAEFNWIVATVAAAFFALLFFIIAMSLLAKYKLQQRREGKVLYHMPQPVEDIYVAVEHENRQDKLYMSLDRNNKMLH